MFIEQLLTTITVKAIKELYDAEIEDKLVSFQQTRAEFEGDLTMVVFPFLRFSKKKPEETATEIGNYLVENVEEVEKINVVNGFINISISNIFWRNFLNSSNTTENFGFTSEAVDSKTVMIEYSSPNTNKPLHLGHIRNNLLGHSISEILKANGNKVIKTNIVNDRGIHICKSMYAWKTWGNGETPESTGLKGDKLVGNYYVKFDQEYKKEIEQLVADGMEEDVAKKEAPIMKKTQEMLIKWEQEDPEVMELWRTMNSWVYEGFDVTYKTLGITFDKIYYESDTYKVGKSLVVDGLEKGEFFKKENGSVWADLSKDGLDEKLLLRADGTSVYMTQDIGTAKMRYDDFNIDKMVYVVGNEQNYHFQVLSILLDRLGFEWGKDLKHFSYGMVELPNGKMKSREGTVVDADDLVEGMSTEAERVCKELGKLDGLSDEEIKNTAKVIALGALKYFILKVDPRKNMLFNPEESIDFNGNTGPFIQYTYARINSVLKRAEKEGISIPTELKTEHNFDENEMRLIKSLYAYPNVIKEAGEDFSPAVISNFVYSVVKQYNRFYHDNSILKEENQDVKEMRLFLSQAVAKIIKQSMLLLGVDVPERM
jgi:arginyl-tRNA synthetase